MAADDPAVFVAGLAFDPAPGVPYPRARPADAARLPADTWAAAQLPVGMRVELSGDAAAVEIGYVTATADLGHRGAGAGTTFELFALGPGMPDGPLAVQPAVLGAGTVRFDLGRRRPERWSVVLPEGMRPTITAVSAVGGAIRPAAPQPRVLCYGDSITEGWVATSPSAAWPAVVGRRLGVDVVNLGYAGAARGEMVTAEELAELSGDVVVVAYGTNCWNRVVHSAAQVAAGLAAFLDLVRSGHPATPMVVLSPLLRPDAESTPNRIGATLSDLRAAIETTVAQRARRDPHLTLVAGAAVVGAEDLADGVHPGDAGHRKVAAAMAPALAAALGRR